MYWRYFREHPAGVFGILALFGALACFGVGGMELRRILRFGREVYPVDGHVETVSARTRRRSARAEIVYRDKDGQLHRIRKSLGSRDARAFGPGTRWELFVSERDPEEVWDASGGRPAPAKTWPWWAGFAGLVALGGVLSSTASARASERLKVLLRGRPVNGEIVRIEERRQRKTNHVTYRAVYAWEIAGTRFSGTSLPLPVGTDAFPGKPVTVFVHPAKPELGEVDVYGARAG